MDCKYKLKFDIANWKMNKGKQWNKQEQKFLWSKIMAAKELVQKTQGQGKTRGKDKPRWRGVCFDAPDNGMPSAPLAPLQCPRVEISGVVVMNAVQPVDAERAKSKWLVKAADNALKRMTELETQLKNLKENHEHIQTETKNGNWNWNGDETEETNDISDGPLDVDTKDNTEDSKDK